MNYSKFYSMIYPFINARWSSMLFTQEWIEATINNWIQQIHNEYKWSWLYDSIEIPAGDFTLVWNRYEATLNYRIKLWLSLDYITWTYNSASNYNYTELKQAKTILELTDNTFVWIGNKIQVTKPRDYLFSFYKEYEYKNYVTDWSLDLWIEDKFIPALYYLVLSQLDMLNVQQADWMQTSNFSKYQYEINKLKSDDIPVATSFIWVNYA